MTRADLLKTALVALAVSGMGLATQGCAATAAAGAVVGVAGTAVGATAKVAGTAVGLGADAVGAAGKAVTGGKR